ncbi:TetR/AcrR family transcriptional regulator [Streptantibioticus silvisoli]|uniref:TetR/AcrR family transcriptional regulator n=1 Tax=Streptantibioticus silvisoli TaxID=2705255 RepID=A0ABT6W2L6_9ACTN|nr:TetR/AcrR family transcriptional regulator [Streptantibioticus silvisoli]MDI5964987.1 TetR/AcrR family transcriptional regulator [Streptantibioticus silvisoli]
MASAPVNPRERYRQQVREEIKGHAWAQVAGSGASALSLNAIAKLMGLSGPALYRYYANRDELVTELVLDAYRELAEVNRAAAAAAIPERRLADLATATRRWALANPHRYLLIYGTPVPGYSAPPEATTVAGGIMELLVTTYAEIDSRRRTAAGPGDGAGPGEGVGPDGTGSGDGASPGEDADPDDGTDPDAGAEAPAPAEAADAAGAAFERHLSDCPAWTGVSPAAPAAARAALTFWTRVHGVISLELAGHFTGMGFDPALLYASEVASLGGAI